MNIFLEFALGNLPKLTITARIHAGGAETHACGRCHSGEADGDRQPRTGKCGRPPVDTGSYEGKHVVETAVQGPGTRPPRDPRALFDEGIENIMAYQAGVNQNSAFSDDTEGET